ncbi:MAG TPA: DUF488 domain-containing protein [Pyrinomonadaceae bacterium]|nr:DUF488 domain-containing protein [Pyrinomonadaceae bacterium]
MSVQLSVWTVGHSTLAIEDFIHLLERCEIQVLADVRSFPSSRRYPQFNKDNLQSSLAANRIEYVHLPELGGRRRARPDSINMSWHNEAFRGYADYMETRGFELGISKLLEMAAARRTAFMCAESLWWRCHRSLISDFLKVKGIEVVHIIGSGKAEPHPYTSAARIIDGELSYRGIL